MIIINFLKKKKDNMMNNPINELNINPYNKGSSRSDLEKII
jgi:hypothetical protein